MLDRKNNDALPPLRLQAGQKTLHACFIGRLFYQKRPVVVVEALRALNVWAGQNGVTLTATIVGEGPYDGTLMRLLRKHGLSSKVALL
ncbi:hypothetical protein QVM29_32160, partial [Pseudomonas aeruginosa]